MSIKAEIEARVGKMVTVEVSSLSANPNAPKKVQYQGDVLRSERWDPPETFRLTGTKEFPVRVIRYSNVLTIDGTSAAPGAKKDDNIVRIMSSKGDKEYVVVLNGNGRHTCDCPGYGFRKTCSHIKQALEKVGKG
jgi:hypothetical protein